LAVDESTQQNVWIGGSYDITLALGLSAAYDDTRVDNAAIAWSTIPASVASGMTGKRGLFVLGATYALSKRSNLYADID
jgi:predicted porin